METKLNAMKTQRKLLDDSRTNLDGWKRDTNIYFDAVERLVKKKTVELQRQVKEIATSLIRRLKEERAEVLKKGNVASEKVEEDIINTEKEIRAAKSCLMLDPDQLAEKLQSKEITLDFPEKVVQAELPIPRVDLTEYVTALDKVSSSLNQLHIADITKVLEETEYPSMGLTDPRDKVKAAASSDEWVDVYVHGQWMPNTGTFSLSLVDPAVEESLRRFSMHTRLYMLKNGERSYGDLMKDPEVGESVLAMCQGAWYRAEVINVKPETRRARVQIVDYGSLEPLDYTQIWPYQQQLGKNEPHQSVECTVLEDISDPVNRRYTEARWFFNQKAQQVMQDSAGSNIIRAKFREEVDTAEGKVWLVDLRVFAENGEMYEFSTQCRQKIIGDVAKASIDCRDVRYAGHEIQTTYVNTKSDEPASEEAAPGQDSQPIEAAQEEVKEEPKEASEKKQASEERSVEGKVTCGGSSRSLDVDVANKTNRASRGIEGKESAGLPAEQDSDKTQVQTEHSNSQAKVVAREQIETDKAQVINHTGGKDAMNSQKPAEMLKQEPEQNDSVTMSLSPEQMNDQDLSFDQNQNLIKVPPSEECQVSSCNTKPLCGSGSTAENENSDRAMKDCPVVDDEKLQDPIPQGEDCKESKKESTGAKDSNDDPEWVVLDETSPDELNSGPDELKTGPDELNTGPDELNTGPDELNTGPNELIELNIGPDELNTGPDELNTGPDELNTGPDELNTGSDELNIGPDELHTGPDELNTGPGELNTGPDELNIGPDELNIGPDELNTGPNELNTGPDELNIGPGELNTGLDELNTGLDVFNTGLNELNTGPDELNTGPNELNTSPDELNTGPDELNTGLDELNTGRDEFNTGLDELNTGPDELNIGPGELNTGPDELNIGPGELNTGPDELNTGPDELNTGPDELNTGPNELNIGPGELNTLLDELSNNQQVKSEDKCPNGW